MPNKIRPFPLRLVAAGAYSMLFLLMPASVCGSGAAEMRTELSVGYDSFIDRFTILELDTMETVHDYHVGLRNGLNLRGGGLSCGLRNIFKYGIQTLDENFDGDLSWRGKKTRIDLRSFFHLKRFQEGSDYSSGNDYSQSNTFAKLRREVAENVHLGLKGRFEIVDYDERTDFDYGYRYYDGGLEFEAGSYFERYFRAGAAIGYRNAPDTTELNYTRIVVDLDSHAALGDKAILDISAIADRRRYERREIRSPYWNILAFGDLTFLTEGGRSIIGRLESEVTMYDSTSASFFDTWFLRGGLRAKFPIRSVTTLYLEPRVGSMSCPDLREERYVESSLVAGIDIIGNGRYWLSASIEPGYREYTLDGNELYSDFFFTRVSLMGNLDLPGGFGLSAFITHDPEYHARRDDDFSITLVSVDLTKRF